jgi:hypothetical protein
MTNTADPKAPPSRAAPSDRDNPPPEYLAFLTILKRVTHPPRGIEFQPMTNIKEELDRCFNDDPEDEEMRACPRLCSEVIRQAERFAWAIEAFGARSANVYPDGIGGVGLVYVDPDAGETPARSCYILFSNSGRTHMCIQGGEVMPGYDGTHHTATHEDHREPALYLLRFLEKARPRDVQVLLRHDGEAVSAPPPKPRRCQRKSGPGAPEPADIRGQRVVRPRRQ